MQKQQIFGLFLLLAVTAAVIGGDRHQLAKQEAAEESAYQALLDAAPVAELTGEAYSPDGRFQMRTAGKSGTYISGVRLPEKLQIVDTETEAVQWEERGYLWQSVLWSPVNNLVALAYSGRTWTAVKVISTAYWTSWEFTLPDGGPIPEYTFLPDDWGTWLDSDTLLLTVGRGGDAGEQHIYRCVIHAGETETTGTAMEQTTETLPGEYDFDHDGEAEMAELVTVLTPETPYFPAWYELRVKRPDGSLLWVQDAGLYHVGWISMFACKIDGRDYLLRYCPWMGQGCYAYDYQLFSLDCDGKELPFRESRVEFDFGFDSPTHQSFDPAAIAVFLEEVHGYLDNSTLLLTTESGAFRTGGSGADFRDDLSFLTDTQSYDNSKSLEENLRALEG